MTHLQKIFKSEARSYYRKLSKHAALEVNFSEMSEAELLQLYTLDEYESDYYHFEMSSYTIVVYHIIHLFSAPFLLFSV